jgi:acetyl esterase/lipase
LGIYAAQKWVAQHGHEHGLDASRIAVAGNSVGGNMSAAITLMANQRSARPAGVRR